MVDDDEMDRIARKVWAPFCNACNRELSKTGKAPERPEMCPRCFKRWGQRSPHTGAPLPDLADVKIHTAGSVLPNDRADVAGQRCTVCNLELVEPGNTGFAPGALVIVDGKGMVTVDSLSARERLIYKKVKACLKRE